MNYKADGTPFWNQFFVAALRDDTGKVFMLHIFTRGVFFVRASNNTPSRAMESGQYNRRSIEPLLLFEGAIRGGYLEWLVVNLALHRWVFVLSEGFIDFLKRTALAPHLLLLVWSLAHVPLVSSVSLQVALPRANRPCALIMLFC